MRHQKIKSLNNPLVFLKTPLLAVVCILLFGFSVQNASAADLIRIDGSSTVYPITEAVAEEYQIKNRSARITIGISGSGGGFKKFCRGETAFSNASRPIKAGEMKLCKKNGIPFLELPVAYDGLAVLVNPKNDWANDITVAELKLIWEPKAQGKLNHWNKIRPHWPKKEIHLFGPGVDSGTFDYFTEAIVGKAQASRGDFTSSEDDNILVQGISNDRYALGYFGFAYYVENKKKLKLLPVDAGKGPISPSPKTIESGSYYLTRPLLIYVNKNALSKPEVRSFLDFYLEEGPSLAQEVGYVPLPNNIRKMVKLRVKKGTVGSMYKGMEGLNQSLSSLLNASE